MRYYLCNMRNEASLGALFPKTRQEILAATLVRPEKAWYAAELARRIGVPSSSLQRELKDLTTASILKTHRRGRMAYYQANVDSPLFADLRGLLLKTAGLADVLRDVLRPLSAQIQVAFVYGSMASGAERHDSDVDLMIIGLASPIDLAVPLRKASELLGREVNPTSYTQEEFLNKWRAKDHFLTRAFDKPMLIVLGSQDELDQLTRPQHHG